MKTIFRYFLVTVCVVAVISSYAQSQSLLEQLQRSTSASLQSYLTPIVSGWAADFNTAFYHSADLHDVLGFDVGIKVSGALIKDENKTYTLTMPNTLTVPNPYGGSNVTLLAGQDYEQNYSLPTAVGDKGDNVRLPGSPTELKNVKVLYSKKTSATGNQEIPLMVLPGGFNVPVVPLLLPQVNLGLPFGIEVMARYAPKMDAGDFGKVSLTGFGLRYDIDQWLPLFPIDIAVHFMTQKFKLSAKDLAGNEQDFLDASATSYGVEISKKFLIFTLYGGFDIQKSKFTVSSLTTVAQPGMPAQTIPGFTVDGVNTSRAVVGVRLLLLIINVHAEYSIAKQPMIAAGVGISIR